jgi:hypothetical protein
MNIDHQFAIDLIDRASVIIDEFDKHIKNALEGDHPLAQSVDNWLQVYDLMNKED